MEIYQQIDFSIPPSKRYGMATKEEVRAAIRFALPELFDLLDDTMQEITLLQRAFFTGIENQAASIIGNHALNDFDSLIDSIVSGNGRDGARASRSLYEHLVNYCEVTASTIANERYIAHRSITAITLSDLPHGLPLLKGAELRKEKNRRKKLKRENLAQAAQAVRDFGRRFNADWAERNLRERARAHGYEQHYDVYKLLSQVTHGSCGGTLGTHADVEGRTVHRIGPSLDLAIFSYLEGLTFFRAFAHEVGKSGAVNTSPLVESINKLIEGWPAYRAALQAIDKAIWPSSPPPPPIAIMALYPNGRIRWFYFEPVLNIMRRALKPAGSEKLEEDFRTHATESNLKYLDNQGGKPMTCSVAGVILTPAPGSKWFKANSVLMSRETPMADWLDGAPKPLPGIPRQDHT
ncbi:DUF5677 domain-containing protein [Streptomyces laurentii]|uniref:DUF5677 domain-containing protein n=1 Tax=Streptomyces laurentii TaxID=39478 RepID=UPI0036AAA73C